MIEPINGPTYAESAQGVMRTRSGIRFSLLEPRVSDVRIEDIAAGLAKLCRFTGQANTHYSVAEHSVRVYRVVRGKTDNPFLWLAALLHDAAEAYCGDVAKPIKDAMRALVAQFGWKRSPYDEIEARVASVIAERFNLPTDANTKVFIKRADNEVYVSEVAQYMVKDDAFAQSWEVAAHEFIRAYNEIMEEIERVQHAA